jgi:hypothetical protein
MIVEDIFEVDADLGLLMHLLFVIKLISIYSLLLYSLTKEPAY